MYYYKKASRMTIIKDLEDLLKQDDDTYYDGISSLMLKFLVVPSVHKIFSECKEGKMSIEKGLDALNMCITMQSEYDISTPFFAMKEIAEANAKRVHEFLCKLIPYFEYGGRLVHHMSHVRDCKFITSGDKIVLQGFLVKESYDGITMTTEEITLHVNLTTGSFYRHSDSKSELAANKWNIPRHFFIAGPFGTLGAIYDSLRVVDRQDKEYTDVKHIIMQYLMNRDVPAHMEKPASMWKERDIEKGETAGCDLYGWIDVDYWRKSSSSSSSSSSSNSKKRKFVVIG